MSQLQFYKYAALFLLLINIGVVSFFWMGNQAPAPRKVGNASEQLHFDEAQHQEFLKIVAVHQEEMELLNVQQRDLLSDYFRTLMDSSIQIDKEQQIQKVQALEKRKIEGAYQHLEDVRNILHEGQLIYFEEFMKHVMRVLLENEQKNPPPPKDF